MGKSKLGWHFLNSDKRLDFTDDRKVRVGMRLKYKPTGTLKYSAPIREDKIKLCEQGMHASREIEQAVFTVGMPSNDDWLCRVEVDGVGSGPDYVSKHKFVGTHRTVLGMIPVSEWKVIDQSTPGAMNSRRRRREIEEQVFSAMERRNRRNKVVNWRVR